MIWGGISYFGLSELVIVPGNQDSKKYCQVLRQGFLPFAAETLRETCTFSKMVHPPTVVTTLKSGLPIGMLMLCRGLPSRLTLILLRICREY